MHLNLNEDSLSAYEALASPVRLQILRLLSQAPANIQSLATALDLSCAITTLHVRKLESSGLIRTVSQPGRHGRQKICSFELDELVVDLPPSQLQPRPCHEFELPVGHYTDISVQPTCGLATTRKVIGAFDDIRTFLDPERVDAGLLWFGQGYVEYTLPLYISPGFDVDELLLTMELGSEYPLSRNDWPSEITFTINGVRVASWISPGDLADRRGIYTPVWWGDQLNQHGILNLLSIRDTGTWLNGRPVSSVTLRDLGLSGHQFAFRLSVEPDARPVGGLTVFGKGFGDYDQDIKVSLYGRPSIVRPEQL